MRTASLVFFFSITASAIAQDKTLDLVQNLGDARFSVREKAQKKLSQKIDLALFIELREIDKREERQEIKRRIGRIIEDYCNRIQPEYRVDLKGYKAFPFIDEGMPDNYALGGRWQGWQKRDFIDTYLQYAKSAGVLQDGKPNWTNYRKATELWMQERIWFDIQEAFRECKDEKDFRSRMGKNMALIQKDIEMLIQGDRDYYKKGGTKNPFERQSELIEIQ